MSTGVRDMAVLVAALVGAVGVETLCWVMLARASAQPEHSRTTVGVVAMLVLGATIFLGPAGLGLPERAFVAGVGVLVYAYLRARIYLPDTLARLGAYLAGKGSPAVVDPRATDPRRLRREQRFMVIGAVITVVGPIISAILYPEMRTYALLWAAVVAIPAAFLLWRWFAASRKRS